jgi:hypothetical protein
MAMFAMSAVAASSASAAEELPHEWLLNGLLIAKPIKIHSLFLILLTDLHATGGEVKVHCKGFNSGTVGPHALDLVETVTAELLGTNDKVPCTFDKAGACLTSTAPTLLALHLPWHTHIYLEGTEVRDDIVSDGNGDPGWAVTCKTIIGNVTDDCTAPLGSAALENIMGGGVLALFDALTPAANCSQGGALAGHVTGDITLHSPSPTLLLSFH